MKISHLTLASMRGARAPQTEPIPFQELLPLKLKNKVSGKGDKNATASCLHEMSILFACLKDNDFSETICAKEIANFQKCHTDFMKQSYIDKEQALKGVMNPGQKNLTHRQVNKLLKGFPNP
uniref:Putative coiled-coil-helix-coiled-coil-helix domain-containing protein 1 n=1 Tax=Xenopsylla cheopis TaxID=163159 RepID=A0A6M2DCM4_XENCH